VQERRAEVLEQLADVLQRDGSRAGSARELLPLTGEGLVGAVLGVIHTRLLGKPAGRMIDLSGPLMGMIVLSYLGPGVAQKELERQRQAPVRVHPPNARGSAKGASPSSPSSRARDPLAGLPMRLTYRTLRVMAAIGELGERGFSPSNREVADHADVSDPGQSSKLLGRLEGLGLIENTGEGQSSGEPNAWRLTLRGEEIRQAVPVRSEATEPQANGKKRSHADGELQDQRHGCP
jgi:hypothetical protein